MPWLVFTFFTTMVALGIRSMMRQAEALREHAEGAGSAYSSSAQAPPPRNEAQPNKATPLQAQEMVACKQCKVFVVRTAHDCGKPDCPYPPAAKE